MGYYIAKPTVETLGALPTDTKTEITNYPGVYYYVALSYLANDDRSKTLAIPTEFFDANVDKEIANGTTMPRKLVQDDKFYKWVESNYSYLTGKTLTTNQFGIQVGTKYVPMSVEQDIVIDLSPKGYKGWIATFNLAYGDAVLTRPNGTKVQIPLTLLNDEKKYNEWLKAQYDEYNGIGQNYTTYYVIGGAVALGTVLYFASKRKRRKKRRTSSTVTVKRIYV